MDPQRRMMYDGYLYKASWWLNFLIWGAIACGIVVVLIIMCL